MYLQELVLVLMASVPALTMFLNVLITMLINQKLLLKPLSQADQLSQRESEPTDFRAYLFCNWILYYFA